MKMALNQLDGAASLSTADLLLKLSTSSHIYLGLALYAISMVFFFKLLAESSLVSVGFSLAVGYVFLMLFAWVFLGESMTWLQIMGALLIVGGVVLVNAR